MKRMTLTLAALALTLPALSPAVGQQFTTAAEVRPILDATRANWVAVREFNGSDELSFTHLMSWRCGLDAIRYSVNGGPMQSWQGEPCYEDEAKPNGLKSQDTPAVFPLGSIETVKIELDYDDGSGDSATYQRATILKN